MESDKLERAVDRVKSLVNMKTNVPYAIAKASGEFNVDKGDVARRYREGVARRVASQSFTPKAVAQKIDATEKCRECGADLDHGDEICGLCGTDVGWIWESSGLTIEEIVRHIKALCEDGLRPSQGIALRKALKVLSREMYRDLSRFRKPINENLLIDVKRRRK
jgi:hypothetical protein